MEIEKLEQKKLVSVQFYCGDEKLSVISLFRDEIERRLDEYQAMSTETISYKII